MIEIKDLYIFELNFYLIDKNNLPLVFYVQNINIINKFKFKVYDLLFFIDVIPNALNN